MDTEPDGTGRAAPLRRARAFLCDGTGPAPQAVRRAVRVTAASCAGFYSCLYGLDRPVAATYALFGAVAMAGLSRIPGTGRQRAAAVAWVLPAGWLLVTLGTLLAVRTWAAVLGMLVIGFVLAFAAVAGPRPGGAAPGLQLLYILPCFPPYEPGTLGERLGGLTLGLVLLIAAEALLLPDPPVPTFQDRLTEAATIASRCARELARAPWALSPGSAAAARAAGQALRPLHLPEAERPAGPGATQRARADACGAARVLLARLRELPPVRCGPPGPADPGPDLLGEVAVAAEGVATAVRTGRDTPAAALERAVIGFRRRRGAFSAAAASSGQGLAAAMSRQAALLEVADAALFLLRAVEVADRRRKEPVGAPDGPFWYTHRSLTRLWWRRLSGHLSPHSVYFQNAVRLSLGLAAARAVAGVASLPHGFWAMLAALTLTRTTVTQTRETVRRALTGTLLGAAAAAVVLLSVGHHTNVYAGVLPLAMLVTFSLGPVLGVGWAQGMFTLVVSMVFAQLAPAGWRLAEDRVLDVLVGSLIGLVIGVFAWPRGAREELRRDTGVLLSAVAGTVTATTAAVAAGRRDPEPLDLRLLHALIMAESTYAQFQSEPRPAAPSGTDWQAALIAGHHALRGARRLLGPHQLPGEAMPGPVAGTWIMRRAERVSRQYRQAGERFGVEPGAPGPGAPEPAAPEPAAGSAGSAGGSSPASPAGVLPALYDTDAWLRGLAADLARIGPAPAPARRRPGRRPNEASEQRA
ncbi:FUSC family protein [Kitasatospora sp. NPDC094015]|uniref:FUSC family protein n=1 Tax=Kitasatospora sp. NPDC094015 TaxID=3155205 RepID=UPI00331763B1